MKKDLELWQFFKEHLGADEHVMLLVVAESSGSSPGRQGFKMAVAENGEMHGSIGGGIMEVKLSELAKKKLTEHQMDPFVKKQFHDKETKHDQSGMICSGEQTVIYFLLDNSHLPEIEDLINLLQQHKTILLELSGQGAKTQLNILESYPDHKPYDFVHHDQELRFVERLGFEKKLFIIGGGHCGLALSSLMSGLDFFIHVIDDREELNTMDKNVFAHEKTILPSYDHIDGLIPVGEDVFVVIMTQGYRSDKKILQQLVGKKFGYIGMLGSEAKIATLKKEFEASGNGSVFENLHAPVGLKINSRTPEEIAVSIAAQVISIKNQ